jgi:hypothetical protein
MAGDKDSGDYPCCARGKSVGVTVQRINQAEGDEGERGWWESSSEAKEAKVDVQCSGSGYVLYTMY